MLVSHIEVHLWHNVLLLLGNDSHLEVLSIVMQLSGLHKTSNTASTDKENIVVSGVE
jgi:hypothetical protein